MSLEQSLRDAMRRPRFDAEEKERDRRDGGCRPRVAAGFRVSDVGAAEAKSSAERDDSKRVETSDAESSGAGERERESAQYFKSLLVSFGVTRFVLTILSFYRVAFYVFL